MIGAPRSRENQPLAFQQLVYNSLAVNCHVDSTAHLGRHIFTLRIVYHILIRIIFNGNAVQVFLRFCSIPVFQRDSRQAATRQDIDVAAHQAGNQVSRLHNADDQLIEIRLA